MRNKLWLSLKRIKYNTDGFTIIELLIAFVILATVAGSLFQVFFVSETNNSRAEEVDIANTMVTSAIELFKSSPDTTRGFTVYYDSEWDEVLRTASENEDILSEDNYVARPPDTQYIFTTRVSKEALIAPDAEQGGNAAVELSLNSKSGYKLVISDVAGDLDIRLNGVVYESGNGYSDSTIPIRVNFDPAGVMPKKISVFNQTDTPVVLNVYNIPEHVINDEKALSSYIQVTPVEGNCGVSYYREYRRQRERYMYYIDASINKIETVGSNVGNLTELVNYRSGKYVVD